MGLRIRGIPMAVAASLLLGIAVIALGLALVGGVGGDSAWVILGASGCLVTLTASITLFRLAKARDDRSWP